NKKISFRRCRNDQTQKIDFMDR
ncbi:MarR family transcriptional regulator, partial [Salmonella enterica]|nr:MarR family transcriptional regulator [Salmonella enterica]EDH5311275.1 MarR family transcriptional regulator [Salmonella enterica subsp. enterica serovar Infantis]